LAASAGRALPNAITKVSVAAASSSLIHLLIE
jgi:hypothetical protein